MKNEEEVNITSDNVDYVVNNNTSPKPILSFWQSILFALLIIIIVASFLIILIQTGRVNSLEATVQAQQATIEALKIIATGTPLP